MTALAQLFGNMASKDAALQAKGVLGFVNLLKKKGVKGTPTKAATAAQQKQSDAGATTDASLAEKDSKRRKRSGRSALTYGTGGGVPKKGLLKTSTKSSKLGG